jgi:arylsulfatase A-like enzyme
VNETPRAPGALWAWASALLAAALALVVVARTRHSAADAFGPPRPAGSAVPAMSASADPAPVPSPSNAFKNDLGVMVRLIDQLDQAVYDAPPWARAEPALDTHWRRMKAPFVGPKGALGRVVQQVGFPSDGDPAKNTEEAPSFTGPIKPIGGVSQRQCIVAPAPSSIRYRLSVPDGALFEAEVAVAGPPRVVSFEVAVRVGAKRTILHAIKPPLDRAHRWTPVRVALSAYAGRTIELELSARSEGKSPWPALALWAAPVVVAPGASDVPYNVLWLSVDALRPDAIAAFHDDASDSRYKAGKPPPLDAWLPRLPEVAPTLDALAKESTIFTRASSVATWTRPGVTAMLSGMRPSELGVTSSGWTIPDPDLKRFYGSGPPLWPLIAREHGFHTRGWVNDFFLIGYSALGVDVGLEALDDHREPIDDTRRITTELKAWLREHKGHRFAVFAHYNSPHAPYMPPKALLDSIPKPPRGPGHSLVRSYLAEVKKDDAAIGEVLAELDRLGLRERTLVIVTADHGETLSAAHDWVVKLDGRKQNMRFRHAPAMWEETARVPILLRLPGKVPAGRRVDNPVTTTDLVPTILDLLRLPIDDRISGRSLTGVMMGKPLAERPLIVEGRSARSFQLGRWRLVERDQAARLLTTPQAERSYELYDLESDPGERMNLIEQRREIAADLMKRLAAVRSPKPLGLPRGSLAAAADEGARPLRVSLGFAGAGARRRVTGNIRAVAGARPAKFLSVETRDAGIVTKRPNQGEVSLDLTTSPDQVIRVEIVLEGGALPSWELELDGKPWPAEAAHLGALGVSVPSAARGLTDEVSLAVAVSSLPPFVDPRLDLGLYATIDHRQSGELPQSPRSTIAHSETMQLLKEWGYVGARSSAH